MRSNLGFVIRLLENSVNQVANGYLFRITEGEGWAPPFLCFAQDRVGV